MSDVFMIVDEENNVAAIRVLLNEREVTLAAIFHEEQDALDFLWDSQDQLSKPLRVYRAPTIMKMIG